MTTTAIKTPRLERLNFGKSHAYRLDCDCGPYRKGDPHKLVGVTTAIDVLDKPALRQWYANQAAERVVDDWDRLVDMKPSERLEFVKWGPRDKVTAAALRGTQIHDLGEKVAHGLPVEVPDEHRGPVEAYARFLDKWDVETIATETPLASTKHGYGGTADSWARIGRRDNAVTLLDIKTGKGVYNEVGLQLAAYRYSEFIQPEKGIEIPTPDVEHVYVAHVLPDDVRMVPVVANEAVFRSFLYVLQAHKDHEARMDWPLVGEAEQP